MASGCLVVGSRTAPVEEVITHEENGFLVDFFDTEEIGAAVDLALARQSELKPLRQRARQSVVEQFDLKRVCLPAQLAMIEGLG